jgi:hypothetical protein
MKTMSMVKRILGASAFALRLRKFAIATLAAATVAVGSLAPVPTASALPRCEANEALAFAYWALGDFCWGHGYYDQAYDYWDMGFDLLNAPCTY